jgi:hypothetical protein
VCRALDALGHLDDGCVVVNRSGRVVSCPSGSWVTGDLVRELGSEPKTAPGWDVTPCPGTPLVLARQP